MERTVSQNKQILKFLKDGFEISPLYALNRFGCLRLSARIYDLKKQGYTIKDRWRYLVYGKVKAYKL